METLGHDVWFFGAHRVDGEAKQSVEDVRTDHQHDLL